MIDGIWLVGERYLIFELAIYYLMQFNSWLSININETWMQKTQKGVRVRAHTHIYILTFFLW